MTYQLADGKLPIIYVRGYAGGAAEISKAVDDPFYGFNEGAVHARSDSSGDPVFYQFESPMLRLVFDHGYQVPVYGDQATFLAKAGPGTVDAATIWIFRFYDKAAPIVPGKKTDYTLETAAEDLFDLIETVLEKTGAPKVFLVAHSMGGLVCRAAIQRIIPETLQIRSNHRDPLDPGAARNYVARVFTYATPHGGIHFDVGHGLFEVLRDATRILGSDIFGPARMYEYLTPGVDRGAHVPEDFNPTEMPENGFPQTELFCLVGSNPSDYDAAAGLSAALVGPRSDGLVQIDNAAVTGAHRAVVHRSHSGKYGIVNSEAGYQNLQRFLFGDLEIKVDLVDFAVGGNSDSEIEFQLDVGLAIRGLPVLVHEQSAAHHCPVLIEKRAAMDTVSTPQPLLTTFLSSTAPRPVNGGERTQTLRHALNLRLLSIRERQGRFVLDDHLEQTDDWNDTLLIDIEPAADGKIPHAWAAWKSEVADAAREWQPTADDRMQDNAPSEHEWVGEKAIPPIGQRLLGPEASIRFTVTSRSLPASPHQPPPQQDGAAVSL